ncbi:nuclear transport factor 2 family protein [Cupriavidus pauculus]|uniref:nuclear transport factor 2 family protein n=1 Tax=Cupriavidus pauculus TaxID=82633 RepID=UPI001EE2BE4C|nr:nuclear transport factor 2 family protein [Cupriavidus pauculus]GJG98021.1 nuclear transport factor 2 family protein [Cupriavidus pauculus]
MTANTAQQAIPALEPLQQYLEAHRTGRAEFIFQAFHADARIISFRDGALHSLTVDEFSKRFQGQPQPDEAQRRRHIASFDVVGNAATAKIVLDYPEVVFTDYMNLLQIDGVWKIANKTFSAAPKAPK